MEAVRQVSMILHSDNAVNMRMITWVQQHFLRPSDVITIFFIAQDIEGETEEAASNRVTSLNLICDSYGELFNQQQPPNCYGLLESSLYDVDGFSYGRISTAHSVIVGGYPLSRPIIALFKSFNPCPPRVWVT